MKTLKLLNKKNILFFLFFIFFNNLMANEPADIWNIEKNESVNEQDNENNISEQDDIAEESISIYELNNQNNENNQNQILQEKNLEDQISLYGL